MRNRLLSELARIIGIQQTIMLARKYGGRTIYVPTWPKMREHHPIALTIGYAPAQVMAREYGGSAINLPNEVDDLLAARNAEIVQRFVGNEGRGQSVKSLAYEFSLDRATIQKIIDAAGHKELRLTRSVTKPPAI